MFKLGCQNPGFAKTGIDGIGISPIVGIGISRTLPIPGSRDYLLNPGIAFRSLDIRMANYYLNKT